MRVGAGWFGVGAGWFGVGAGWLKPNTVRTANFLCFIYFNLNFLKVNWGALDFALPFGKLFSFFSTGPLVLGHTNFLMVF